MNIQDTQRWIIDGGPDAAWDFQVKAVQELSGPLRGLQLREHTLNTWSWTVIQQLAGSAPSQHVALAHVLEPEPQRLSIGLYRAGQKLLARPVHTDGTGEQIVREVLTAMHGVHEYGYDGITDQERQQRARDWEMASSGPGPMVFTVQAAPAIAPDFQNMDLAEAFGRTLLDWSWGPSTPSARAAARQACTRIATAFTEHRDPFDHPFGPAEALALKRRFRKARQEF